MEAICYINQITSFYYHHPPRPNKKMKCENCGSELPVDQREILWQTKRVCDFCFHRLRNRQKEKLDLEKRKNKKEDLEDE